MYHLSDQDAMEVLRAERLAEQEAATRSLKQDTEAERLAAARAKQREWDRERRELLASTPAMQQAVDALYEQLDQARAKVAAARERLEGLERERDDLQRRVISRNARVIRLSGWLGESWDAASDTVQIPDYPPVR